MSILQSKELILPEAYRASCTILSKGINKFEAFAEMIHACRLFSDEKKAGFLSLVTAREHLASTGISHGIALAHGKVNHLEHPFVLLGISKEGIHYDDIYKEPVKLLFIIASARDNESGYVQALRCILTWVHGEALREAIERLDFSNEDVVAFFEMLKTQQFVPYKR